MKTWIIRFVLVAFGIVVGIWLSRSGKIGGVAFDGRPHKLGKNHEIICDKGLIFITRNGKPILRVMDDFGDVSRIALYGGAEKIAHIDISAELQSVDYALFTINSKKAGKYRCLAINPDCVDEVGFKDIVKLPFEPY